MKKFSNACKIFVLLMCIALAIFAASCKNDDTKDKDSNDRKSNETGNPIIEEELFEWGEKVVRETYEGKGTIVDNVLNGDGKLTKYDKDGVLWYIQEGPFVNDYLRGEGKRTEAV